MQRELASSSTELVDFDLSSSSENVAYALIVSGSSKVPLSAYTIDMSSGKIVAKKTISSFNDDPAGESTREFLWDSSEKLFYYFDANFTSKGGARPSSGREVYMFSVDPTTGSVKKSSVQGAIDFPTGYVMRSDGHVVLACEKFENDKMTGFNFYDLNPLTSKAELISTTSRGDDESDPGFYSGFHRGISADDTQVYRFGYLEVTTQQGQGVGITSLSERESSKTLWKSELSKDHDYFMTLNRYGSSFISLAPSTSDSSRNLDVVQWNLNETVYQVVASLKNAHPPRVVGGGDLGYLADFVNGNTYAGLVVQDSDLPYGIGDRWALATGDLTDSSSFKVLPLEPRDIAGVLSVSGFGM